MRVARILEGKGCSVLTAMPSESVAGVAAALAENRIGAVPMISVSGGLAGIVSERDIVAALARRGCEALDRPAGEIMTRNVVTCRPDDHIHDIMARMTEWRIRHLPVLDDNGQLAGIVSIGDIVKARLGEIEAEAKALKDYITTA